MYPLKLMAKVRLVGEAKFQGCRFARETPFDQFNGLFAS